MINSKFYEYNLDEVCSRLSSGKNIPASEVFEKGLYPVYGGNGLRGYADKSNFEGDCAIVGRQGAFCGNVRFFSGKGYMTEHAVVVCGNEKSDTRYLSYLLSTMQLGRLSGQSAQPGLAVGTLAKQKILLPPLAEQQRIAKILSSLDDKIELNNAINRNLEEQAQAIFKSWFIDFEPFGGIKPENWNEVCLKDCCSSITDGVHNTVIDDPDGDFYLLSCKNIKGGVLSIGSDERKINKETFDKLRKRTKLAKGDILLSSVGTVGEMLLLTKDPENIEFQRSVAIIKAERNLISPEFLYNSLIAQKDTIVNAAHGAVQQCIFLSDIGDFKTILPTSEYMNKYTLLVSPYYEQISKNQDENMHLISMRDTLLPKLMSGGMELSR